MTRSNASARAAGARFEVTCPECQQVRYLKHAPTGRMCRGCAADLGQRAAATRSRPTPSERFMALVDIRHPCWLWTGRAGSNGYGLFYLDGRQVLAHRFAYEWHIGPIPDGLEIDHLCRVRLCVTPTHLEPVTHAENMRRSRRAACINGHQLTDDTIYVHNGKRYCRLCRLERNRA